MGATGKGNGSIEISLRDARRIALAAQGFATPVPTGRVDRRHFRSVLNQVGTVQLDSVNVLTRSHELVFFARLGSFDREALTQWLWSSREVFEYWGHEASVHPVDRHRLLRWRMSGDHAWGGVRRAAGDHPDLVAATLETVLERGPVSVGELEAHLGTNRRGGSWWRWSDTKRVVEHLFHTGAITATRRNGFTRFYMAPERWLPAEVLAAPTPSGANAQRSLLLAAAQAIGVGTARDLADYFRMPVANTTRLLDDLVAQQRLLPARVEGWRQPAYLHPDARLPRRKLRARALLSPFDSLIWERQRTERLWGLRYRIEIYVPAPKRVHGYYVLPFLLDEMLVARVDLKADRQAGVLRVRAAWDDAEADPDRTANELATTLAEMASWLDLTSGVAVEGRGSLAPHLERALTQF